MSKYVFIGSGSRSSNRLWLVHAYLCLSGGWLEQIQMNYIRLALKLNVPGTN